jgi:hypothetical protein
MQVAAVRAGFMRHLELNLVQLEGVCMRRLFLALLIGCLLSILPIAILKLPTDSGMVGSLKRGITNLMVPGVFGLIVSGGRIDDINPWVRVSQISSSILALRTFR